MLLWESRLDQPAYEVGRLTSSLWIFLSVGLFFPRMVRVIYENPVRNIVGQPFLEDLPEGFSAHLDCDNFFFKSLGRLHIYLFIYLQGSETHEEIRPPQLTSPTVWGTQAALVSLVRATWMWMFACRARAVTRPDARFCPSRMTSTSSSSLLAYFVENPSLSWRMLPPLVWTSCWLGCFSLLPCTSFQIYMILDYYVCPALCLILFLPPSLVCMRWCFPESQPL